MRASDDRKLIMELLSYIAILAIGMIGTWHLAKLYYIGRCPCNTLHAAARHNAELARRCKAMRECFQPLSEYDPISTN